MSWTVKTASCLIICCLMIFFVFLFLFQRVLLCSSTLEESVAVNQASAGTNISTHMCYINGTNDTEAYSLTSCESAESFSNNSQVHDSVPLGYEGLQLMSQEIGELLILKRLELKEAIAAEDFEFASELKVEISTLQTKLSNMVETMEKIRVTAEVFIMASELKVEMEKLDKDLLNIVETMKDLRKASVLKVEAETLDKKLTEKLEDIRKQDFTASVFEITAELKLNVKTLNEKITEVIESIKDLRKKRKFPDATEMQSTYFNSSWDIHFDKSYISLKPQLDDALSVIGVFIEEAAADGKPSVAFRVHENFGFQVFTNGWVNSFGEKYIRVLTDLINSEDSMIGSVGHDGRKIQSLKNNIVIYKKHLNEIKNADLADDTLRSLDEVFNTEKLPLHVGVNYLKYFLLKSGYTVGASSDWPLIISIRGNDTNLERNFNLYQHNNYDFNHISPSTYAFDMVFTSIFNSVHTVNEYMRHTSIYNLVESNKQIVTLGHDLKWSSL